MGKKDAKAKTVTLATDKLDNNLSGNYRDERKAELRKFQEDKAARNKRLVRVLYVVVPIVLMISYGFLFKHLRPRVAIGLSIMCALAVGLS